MDPLLAWPGHPGGGGARGRSWLRWRGAAISARLVAARPWPRRALLAPRWQVPSTYKEKDRNAAQRISWCGGRAERLASGTPDGLTARARAGRLPRLPPGRGAPAGPSSRGAAPGHGDEGRRTLLMSAVAARRSGRTAAPGDGVFAITRGRLHDRRACPSERQHAAPTFCSGRERTGNRRLIVKNAPGLCQFSTKPVTLNVSEVRG